MAETRSRLPVLARLLGAAMATLLYVGTAGAPAAVLVHGGGSAADGARLAQGPAAPADVRTAIDPSPYNQHAPALAGDSSGALLALWVDSREGQDKVHVRFAYRPAGESWQASVKVDPTATKGQSSPRLAVDGSGNAYAVWVDGRSDTWQLYFAYRPAGGDWTGAEPVAPAPRNRQLVPALAVNRRGEAVAAWWQETGTRFELAGAARPVGGPWGGPETITARPLSAMGSAGVALDSSGRASVIWTDQDDVVFSSRPAGGGWGEAELLRDSSKGTASGALVAVDGAGNVQAAWVDTRGGYEDIYAAYRPAGGPWSTNVRVTDDDSATAKYSPDLLVDGAGNATVVWLDERQPQSGVYAANRSRGHGWSSNLLLIPAIEAAAADGLARAPGAERMASMVSVDCSPQLVNDVLALVSSLPVPGLQGVMNLYFEQWPGMVNDQGSHSGNAEDEPASNPDTGSTQVDLGIFTDDLATGLASLFGTDAEEPAGAPWWVNAGDDAYAQHQQLAHDLACRLPALDLAGFGSIPEYALVDMTPDELAMIEQIVLEAETDKFLDQLAGVENAAAAEQQIAQMAAQQEQADYQEWLAADQAQKPAAPQWPAAEPPSKVTQVSPQPTRVVPTAPAAAPPGGAAPVKPGKPSLAQHYQNVTSQVINALFGKPQTEPIAPNSGEFVYGQTPLHVPGRGMDYMFHLTYRSQLVYDGPAGWGWTHNYDRRLVATGGGSLGLWDGMGLNGVFSFDGRTVTPSAGRYTAVVSSTTGIALTDRTGIVEDYFPLGGGAATAGRLRSITDRNANTLTLAYDAGGRLEAVTDTLGRVIRYAYDGASRLSTVTDFANRVVRLDYDANGDLVAITTAQVTGTPNGNDFPAGKTIRFAYSSGFADPRLNHNLTTVIMPNEVADGALTPSETNTYGQSGLEFDRVVSQSWGGGRSNASGVPAGGEVRLSYSTAVQPDDPPGTHSRTTVTDRGGNVRQFWFDGSGHRLRSRQVVDGQEIVYEYTYNADGEITSVTYPQGNRLEMRYDDTAKPRLAQGDLLEVRQVPDSTRGCDGTGAAPCPALVTRLAHEPVYHRLTAITDPRGATTAFTRDSRGNLTDVTFPPVTVGPAAPQTAAMHWTRDGAGRPLTFTDPEGAVTRYDYYQGGPQVGRLERVVQDEGGVGQATAFEYDAVGYVSSVTDGRGTRTDYAVNALGQVVRVSRASAVSPSVGTSPPDYETLYFYDANDNLVRTDAENVVPELDNDIHPTGAYVRDPANPWWTTTYTYDLLDNLVQVTAEVGPSADATTEYRYDAQGELSSVVLPAGHRLSYEYDAAGRLRRVTQGAGSPDAATTAYEYGANGKLVQRRDGNSHPTDFFYDGFDRYAGAIDALGNVTAWRRDASGNVVEQAVSDGQDGRNPGREPAAAGLVTLEHTRTTYDERNRPVQSNQEYFTADVGSGELTKLATDGNGDGWAQSTWRWDRSSNLVAATDDRGATTSYEYDGLNRRTRRVDALGDVAAYTYDGGGNLTRVEVTDVQPEGLAPAETAATAYVYDAVSRLVAETNPLGQTARYAYDSRGNRVFQSDANGTPLPASNDHGNTALFAYDGQGHLLSETHQLRSDGLGTGAVVGQVTMAYAYDADGNRTQVIDPGGNLTALAYDDLDRLERRTTADGAAVAYSYDRAGNLVRTTDANGTVVVRTYDAVNRHVRTEAVPGPGVGGTQVQTFAFDGRSRLVAATDGNDPASLSDDSTLRFAYDSLGNVRRTTEDDLAIDRTFDGTGNLLNVTYPGGAVLTYAHDELGRVKRIQDAGGTVASFTYIGARRPWERTNGNGTVTTHIYDAARRLVGLHYRPQGGQTDVTGFEYIYDRAGNLVEEVQEPGHRTATYTYDSLYRLVAADTGGMTYRYSYDAGGDRVRVETDGQGIVYRANDVHEYVGVGDEARLYDANGNLRQVLIGSGPAQGPQVYLPFLLGRGPAAASSVAQAGPAGVRLGDSGGGSRLAATGPVTQSVATYRYDFANRLIGLTTAVTVTTGAGQNVTTAAFAVTHDALGREVTSAGPDGKRRAVYAGDQLVEERDASGAVVAAYIDLLTFDQGGGRAFYQTDLLGSVRALADSSGSVSERVDYKPYGAMLGAAGGSAGRTGSAVLFRGLLGARGQEVYVIGSRRYDPRTGSFLQRGPAPLGNPYSFLGDNPLSPPTREPEARATEW